MGREFPQSPVVGVAAVVIDDDRVLLVKRKYEPLKGEWSLPGGVLELGETMHAGVMRELLEETGLEVEATAVVEVLDKIYREGERVKYHYVLIDFLCSVVGGNLQAATDAQEACWVRGDQLNMNSEHKDRDYKLAPATMLVIEKAFRMAQTARFAGTAAGHCDQVDAVIP